MKEQLPTIILSSSSDRQVFVPAIMDLTPAHSDSGSNSVAADDSNPVPASAFQIAKKAQLTNWTDDMHRLYLDSLEASFVKELHNSLQVQAWSLGSNVTLMQTNCPNSRDKCMVFRDGCWQNIEFKMSESLMDSTADSPFFKGGIQTTLNPSLLRSCENRQPKNSITSFGSAGNFERMIEYDFICRDSVKFLIKTSWMTSPQEFLLIQLGLNDEKYLQLIFWAMIVLYWEISYDKFINYFNRVYQKDNPNAVDCCNLSVHSEIQSESFEGKLYQVFLLTASKSKNTMREKRNTDNTEHLIIKKKLK